MISGFDIKHDENMNKYVKFYSSEIVSGKVFEFGIPHNIVCQSTYVLNASHEKSKTVDTRNYIK